MKKFIHLSASVCTTISLNGTKTYEINSPLLKWVDICAEKEFYISFLPKDQKKYLPVTINSSTKNQNDILRIPYFNNHTDIIYSPTKTLTLPNDIVLMEKKLGDVYVKVVKGEKTHLCISSPSAEILSKQIPDLISVYSETSNYFLLKGITTKNTQYILILNLSNNNVVLEDEFNIIEENTKNIKLLKFVKDLSRHGIVQTFDKKSMSIDKYSVYENKKPLLVDNKDLIPLAFLESLKYNDFNLCKYYLKDNLISNEYLTSYFGNIEKIFFNPYNDDNVVNYTVLSQDYKSYNFIITDNKITDIEEMSLN